MLNGNASSPPIGRTFRQSPRTEGNILSLLIAFGLVIILGMLAVGLYAYYDLTAFALAAIGLGVPAMWLVWKYPAIGVVILAFFTSGFVPAKAFDVRLPVGGLDARDLTLLGLFALLLARALVHGQLPVPWRWVGVTIAAFLALATLSVLDATLALRVEPNWALSELRTIAYYATFFLVALAVQNRKQLVILLAGLFVIADLTASTLIIQQFFGKSNPILSAMSGGTWNVWKAYQGDPTLGNTQVLRIIPPGHVLTFFMSIVAFCLMLSEGAAPFFRLFFAAQFAYLNLGLIFTYSRAQWVASAIALVLVVVLLPGRAKARLVLFSLAGALTLVVGFSVVYSVAQEAFGNQVLNAVQARADSILNPDKTLASNSLEWRLFETDEATKSITRHPIFGVGLGAIYRPPTALQGEDVWGIRDQYRLTRFVHDSYLYITVKMGVVGLLTFLVFVATLLWTGWTQLRRLHDGQLSGVTLALLASFVGLMAWAVTQAHFLQTESTTVVGLAAGMIAIMDRIETRQTRELGRPRSRSIGVRSASVGR